MQDMFRLLSRVEIKPGDVGVPAINVNDATVSSLLNTVYFWTGAIAVIVLIVAGFYFVTSNGDAAQIARAKKAILGSVIGIVVIMFAFVITQFVIMGVTEGA